MAPASGPHDDGSWPQLPPGRALPSTPRPSNRPSQSGLVSTSNDITATSTDLSRNNNESTNVGSRRATGSSMSGGRHSYSEILRNTSQREPSDGAPDARPGAVSGHQLRTKSRRPSERRTTAVPVSESSSHRTVAGRNSRDEQPPVGEDGRQRDAAQPVLSSDPSSLSVGKEVPSSSRTRNVPPTQKSQDTSSDASFGLQTTEGLEGRVKPTDPRLDSPRANQVDPTTKPSTPPALLSDQPGNSMSPSLPHAAAAMAKTMSSHMPSHHGVLVDKGKGKLDSNEQNHSSRSTASHRPTLLAKNDITMTESPPPHQSGSGSHHLGRSNSRIQENEGVEGKVVRAPGPPTSEKERKRTTASEETEPTLPSSYTPPENSIEWTYFPFSHKSDSGPLSLPDTSKSRGEVGRPSDSALSLAGTGSSTTRPPPSFTTQSQPKHITRASSTNSPSISSADHRPRPSNVARDSQIHTAPSIHPSMSSRAPAPATSRVAHGDVGTPPGPIKPSNSMRPVGQPHAVAVDGPHHARTLQNTVGDASLRLPSGSGGDSEQTRIPSHPQLDPTHEPGENSPLAKPGDRQGLIQPSARSPPAISKAPSKWKARSPHGPPPSEPQSSRSEKREVPPNEQHPAGPDTKAQKDVSPPELGTSTGDSSHYSPRPLARNRSKPSSSGNRPNHPESTMGQMSGGEILHLEHALPPSSYESETPPAVSSTQEGLSSRPTTMIPQEVHNESTTKSAQIAPESKKTSPNLTEKPQGEPSDESKTRTRHPPTSVHTADDSAHRAEPSHSRDPATTTQSRGPLDQLNTPWPNVQQGSTLKDPNSSSKVTDALTGHPRNPMETLTKATTTQSPPPLTRRPPSVKTTKQHTRTDALSTLQGRDGGPSTIGRSGPSQADARTEPHTGQRPNHPQLLSPSQRVRSDQPSPQRDMTSGGTPQPRQGYTRSAGSQRNGPSANAPSQPKGSSSIFSIFTALCKSNGQSCC